MSEVFFAPMPTLLVECKEETTELEKEVLFNNLHSYRGDRSEYLLRSTQTRVKYKDQDFPPHTTENMKRGDVLIDNEGYGQYKGETQIALKEMHNDGRVNIVGRIVPHETFLLSYLQPWSSFQLKEFR